MRLYRVAYITYCFYALSLQGFKKTSVNVSSPKKHCVAESLPLISSSNQKILLIVQLGLQQQLALY